MNLPDDWVWGAPQWGGVATAVGGLLAVLVIWNYASGNSKAAVRWLAASLKLAAIVLLAVCLLQPMRTGTRPKPQANLFAILVDNSQSMSLRESPNVPTRGERVAVAVDPDTAWRQRLAQDFDVRTYSIDSRLESSSSIHRLPGDGPASSIGGGLEQLATRLKGRPLAGVLLFTDGNTTESDADSRDWSRLGFPVYPVLPAGDASPVDLRIGDVAVTRSDFETAPVTVRVSIRSDGMAGRTAAVRLIDLESGAIVEEQTIKTADGTGDGGTAKGDTAKGGSVVTFRFRPLGSGVRFYRAETFLAEHRDKWNTDTATGEVTFRNNSRLVTVEATGGPYRVLYLAGRPNWDFKFLRRAIEEDAETELVGLLRIADKEAKFTFRDRDVTAANPLFAGSADGDDETAQRYDEAVMIRLGVRDGDELARGFPRTEEELYRYQAIILDDIEPDFFSQDQLMLIRRFVAQRGGGLLLMGGPEAFAGKRFAQGPLGELSPVYAARDAQTDFALDARQQRRYRFELTREGMIEPWVRLRDNEQAEAARLATMPEFHGISPIGAAKPGASVLGIVRAGDGQPIPAVVTQRFGKGRCAAIPVTDLWRWSMRRGGRTADGRTDIGRTGDGRTDDGVIVNERPAPGKALLLQPRPSPPRAEETVARDDPAQTWRQVTRWLVNDSPRRVECRVVAGDAAAPTRVITTVLDEAFLPSENATVRLEITPPSGPAFTANAAADFESPGQYVSEHWAGMPGGYRVTARATDQDGTEIGIAETGWSADPGAAEFRDLAINRPWLQRLADATGGEIIDDRSLDAFITSLPNRKVPVTQTWVYPIWHRPWVMLAAILCLCGEWGLRRWKGMP
jgi:uncharacterized membrane protein